MSHAKSDEPDLMLSRAEEQELIARLRAGDEGAFVELLDAYHKPLCRLASVFVSDPWRAEEIVQEAWLVVIDQLSQFEGRSSLKTWLFSIVVNKAKKLAVREARQVLSELDELEQAMAPDAHRFDERGHWSSPPGRWSKTPEQMLIEADLLALVQEIIETLPALQRTVITMRDVQDFTAQETCEVLQISAEHHRVLLHRARTAVREALDRRFAQTTRGGKP